MSHRNLTRGVAMLTAGLLMGVPTLPAQEIREPVPSTPNPAGSVVPPADADGVVPAVDSQRPTRTEVAPDQAAPAARQLRPMTAEDLQRWQQIATLHEQFVRSHVRGAAASQDVSRTDPDREQLRRLWERLAEIERQLIVTGAFNESPETVATTTRAITRPFPGRDLDEVPDPLTTTNQAFRSSENDRDQSTARALAQEDRSSVADPAASAEVVSKRQPSEAIEVEAVREVSRNPRPAAAPASEEAPVADTGNLWQEFIEVRRQILMAEIAAAQAIAGE